MKLHQAFEITPGEVVALIGAGGKTSLMVGLGYELAEAGWRVLATTTTHLERHQLDLMPTAIPIHSGAKAISEALNRHQFVFLYSEIHREHVYGPDPMQVPRLLDGVDSDVLLIEADHARGLPLKAPMEGEPVIPPGTSLVLPVASLSAIGKPLDEEHVYNAQAMTARYGFPAGAAIKSPWVAQVLRDDQLGLRGVPPNIRTVAFLNRIPRTGYGRGRARLIAKLMLRSNRFRGVVLGTLRGGDLVHEVQRPLAALVLAAGLSTRMGQPKVLLPWTEGRTILEHIVDQLVKSRVDHVLAVTGHEARQVKALMKPLDVQIAHNRNYKTGGMLSSVKAGLEAMPDHIAAALLVLGDQPRIQPRVIYELMNTYARADGGDLIIPRFEMKRGFPILIGRRYWPEILSLPPDGSLYEMIEKHADRIVHVQVDTDSVVHNVDTPQDYQQERWRAGL